MPVWPAVRILSFGVEAASADNADVAQLAEQLFCKQPVAGSSPIVGSGGVFFRQCMILGSCQSGQLGLAVNQVLRLRWFESATAHHHAGSDSCDNGWPT